MPFRVQYPDTTGPYREWDDAHDFLFTEHSDSEHPVPEYDGLNRLDDHYFAHPTACTFLQWWGPVLPKVLELGMEVIHFNAPTEISISGKQCMFYLDEMRDVKTIL